MKQLKEIIAGLKRKNLFRTFRTISSANSATVNYKSKNCIMLASNNYFNLNVHPKVILAAKNAVEKYGTGNCASRLVVNSDLHEKLENEIARYKKCESALVYSSGYAANLGIISSVVSKNDVIISDELNHASIIDGCKLSGALVKIYRHCDVLDLEKNLKNFSAKRILVVTDSVFSMEGDIAPLKEIIKLKKKYEFILMVDDAHATGIIDTNFGGIDIHMGTLSKSLASVGGYAAGSKDLIDFLRNKSRPFIYSTGLSPADCAAALESLKIIKKNKSLRLKLLSNANYIRKGLLKLGFPVGGNMQIISLVVGDVKNTLKFQELLEKEKTFVTAIRPPTVSKAMLRISVMSSHTKEQLDFAIKAFEKVGKNIKRFNNRSI